MEKDAMQIIMFFFMGMVFLMVVSHASGFSTAAGSLFTGFEGMGTLLSGQNVKAGT